MKDVNNSGLYTWKDSVILKKSEMEKKMCSGKHRKALLQQKNKSNTDQYHCGHPLTKTRDVFWNALCIEAIFSHFPDALW